LVAQLRASQGNWRLKHEEFQRALKMAKGADVSDLPPPPANSNPDYVKCDFCGRSFNETAAARHIPHCRDSQTRAKPAAAASQKRK
jgi:hypothetical protein